MVNNTTEIAKGKQEKGLSVPAPKSYNNEMENTIQYELTPKKVKNIIIRVKANGVVAVTMPYRMSKKKVDAFVQSKAEWIRMMQKKLANQQRIDVDALEWNRQKEQYLRDILLREYELFRAYHIPMPTVRFCSMISRYGSCCKAKASITLNKVLADLPLECAEYVAAHELAHLVEANHSRRFYQVLDTVMSDHRIREKRLREYALFHGKRQHEGGS